MRLTSAACPYLVLLCVRLKSAACPDTFIAYVSCTSVWQETLESSVSRLWTILCHYFLVSLFIISRGSGHSVTVRVRVRSGFTADDINLLLHSRQQVGVTLRVISIRHGALLQPLGGAMVCCARNRKWFRHMVSGI